MAEVPASSRPTTPTTAGFEVWASASDTDKTIASSRRDREKGMTWRQVADGKGWKAEIGSSYASQHPAAFLVMETPARSSRREALRGAELDAPIKKRLAKKKGAQ